MAAGLAVDTAMPWLAPFAPGAQRVIARTASGIGVAEALAGEPPPIELAAGPLRFVPGWWAANQAPGFYDDPFVFRRPRAEGGNSF